MADLSYKSVTLVELPQPEHVRGQQFWLGTEGNPSISVELAVGLNIDSGVYTAFARVIRSGVPPLPAGVAEGIDWQAAMDSACDAFIARCDKPVGQRKPREANLSAADRAALRAVADRTRVR